MFDKPLDKVELADVEKIVLSGQLPESKMLEYKQEIPFEQGKKQKQAEFLKDIVAMCNAQGGYIIYGIEEKGGLPSSFQPFEVDNCDAYCRTIEDLIEDRVKPKISDLLSFQWVRVSDKRFIFIINIARSFKKPHVVLNYKQFTCPRRLNTSVKYLDYLEFKTEILAGGQQEQKILDFKQKRISNLVKNNSFIPLVSDHPLMILHIIPFSFLNNNCDVEPFCGSYLEHLPLLIEGRSLSRKLNIDGLLIYSPGENSWGYTQLYRSGIIESVGVCCDQRLGDKPYVYDSFERLLLENISIYLNTLEKMQIQGPFFCFISFVNVKGCRISSSSPIFIPPALNKNLLELPACEIEQYDADLTSILTPSFSHIWNAFGMEYPHKELVSIDS